jgi:REP element-mobilizing transposase RayT
MLHKNGRDAKSCVSNPDARFCVSTNNEKWQGKYRIPSARWATWDYASNAAYFITICAAHREHYFGEVVDGAMVLTPIGQAAQDCWNEIPAHFPFVLLDAFVVMPNHTHGILVIDKPDVETQNLASPFQTQNLASLHASLPSSPNKFGPQSRNLASIVRGYKIGVTKFAHQNNLSFAWQERYHDHVIRNDDEYQRIHQYIIDNPQKWSDDMYFAIEG